MNDRNGKAWTRKEKRTLTVMWNRGDSVAAIGDTLGRGYNVVLTRANKMGLRPRKAPTWTTERLAQFYALRARGVMPKRIALEMGMSPSQIARRIRNDKKNAEIRNLAAEERRRNGGRAKRLCLGGCNEMFDSSGIGNRMCDRCIARGHSNVILEPAGARA